MRTAVKVILALVIFIFGYYAFHAKEGFADIDDSLLHINNQVTSGLPKGSLCINGSQCLSKTCKSSLTGLVLTGQDTDMKNVPLAKYGNCL